MWGKPKALCSGGGKGIAHLRKFPPFPWRTLSSGVSFTGICRGCVVSPVLGELLKCPLLQPPDLSPSFQPQASASWFSDISAPPPAGGNPYALRKGPARSQAFHPPAGHPLQLEPSGGGAVCLFTLSKACVFFLCLLPAACGMSSLGPAPPWNSHGTRAPGKETTQHP